MAKSTNRASVKENVLVTAFINGNKAGKSNKQIAESLNMEDGTFNVRLSNLRKKVRTGTATYKVEGVEYTGAACAKKYNVPLSIVGDSDAFAKRTKHKIEMTKAGKELPGAVITRQRTDMGALENLIDGLMKPEDEVSDEAGEGTPSV